MEEAPGIPPGGPACHNPSDSGHICRAVPGRRAPRGAAARRRCGLPSAFRHHHGAPSRQPSPGPSDQASMQSSTSGGVPLLPRAADAACQIRYYKKVRFTTGGVPGRDDDGVYGAPRLLPAHVLLDRQRGHAVHGAGHQRAHECHDAQHLPGAPRAAHALSMQASWRVTPATPG